MFKKSVFGENENLWLSFYEEEDIELKKRIRTNLSEKYQNLVEMVAKKSYHKFKDIFEYYDLVSIGYIGLFDAIEKFDPKKEIKFETYASLRITGTILDNVRKLDVGARSERIKQKVIEKIKEDIKKTKNREATKKEIMETIMRDLKMSEQAAERYIKNSETTKVVSFDEYENYQQSVSEDIAKLVTEEINIKEMKDEIKSIREGILDERANKIIDLCFYKNKTLREIGEILNISECRVSQIRKKSLEKMKQEIIRTKKIYHPSVS